MSNWNITWVETATGNGSVMASFSPWDAMAHYIRMILIKEGTNDIQDEICLPRNQTQATFTGVPCNETYSLYFRSYDANNMTLMSFYYESPHTIKVPCVNDVPGPSPPRHTALDFLTIVAVTMTTVFLLLLTLFCLWRERKAIKSKLERQLNFLLHRTFEISAGINNCKDFVFPIYCIESEAYREVIHAHIRLLHSKGVNVSTYDDQRPNIQKDACTWVNTCLKQCTSVLVYHSKTLDDLMNGLDLQESSGTFGEVCRFSLRQLDTINRDIKTVHVTFDVYMTPMVKDVIRLVKEDDRELSLINLDTVLKRLSTSGSQAFHTETEMSAMLRSVHEFYESSQGCYDSTITLSETDTCLYHVKETVDDNSFHGRLV